MIANRAQPLSRLAFAFDAFVGLGRTLDDRVGHFDKNQPPKLYRNSITGWIKKVANKYGKIVGDVSFIFCDDIKILEINKQFLNHDYYTDVITFDYTEGDVIGGDIFISLETVKSNAKELDSDGRTDLKSINALQDLLIYALQGLSQVAVQARAKGVSDAAVNRFISEGVFSTLTNVDFDPARFQVLINCIL